MLEIGLFCPPPCPVLQPRSAFLVCNELAPKAFED